MQRRRPVVEATLVMVAPVGAQATAVMVEQAPQAT
jgi:hypothetical protein